jgi:predicted  nucleic acid-binding Zn-ribbon protein
LRYATFVVPLVKAVQEQQEIIEDYEARMSTMEQEATELKSRMEQEAAELKSSLTELLQRMEALESKKGN